MWATTAADGGRLEGQLREQLDRMFLPNEYLLDVQLKSLPEPASPSNAPLPPLPGLGFGALPSENAAVSASTFDAYRGLTVDVLLVVDTTASRERARLAEDVVRRVVDGVGLGDRSSIKSRQQKIVRPPEPVPPPPEAPKSLFDQIQDNKALLIRLAIVAWGAFVSLLVVYGLVRRFSSPSPPLSDRNLGAGLPPRTAAPKADEAGEDIAGKAPASSRAKAPAKDELYSKDKAFLDQINDVVSEARSNSAKVAKVLTRWVGLAEENARYAAIFLKNCDIKTVEAVSALLHPADIEKIIRQNIEDFDAFGEENQRVLDLMRSDLALLSAERMFRERPDPLDFTKTMSEEEVAALIGGESLELVALVATQIPPHRMQKYYATLAPNDLNRLCALISTMESPSLEQFEAVREALLRKAESIGSVLFTDKMRGQTLLQLLLVVPSPSRLVELASTLRQVNEELYVSVRPRLILPGDLEHLPQRALALLTQAVDADVLGMALSGLGRPFERMSALLPEAYRVVFLDKLTQPSDGSTQNAAWQRIAGVMRDLVSGGMISESELQAARSLADGSAVETHGGRHAA